MRERYGVEPPRYLWGVRTIESIPKILREGKRVHHGLVAWSVPSDDYDHPGPLFDTEAEAWAHIEAVTGDAGGSS